MPAPRLRWLKWIAFVIATVVVALTLQGGTIGSLRLSPPMDIRTFIAVAIVVLGPVIN